MCHQAGGRHTNAELFTGLSLLASGPCWLLGTTDTIKFLIRAPAPDITRTLRRTHKAQAPSDAQLSVGPGPDIGCHSGPDSITDVSINIIQWPIQAPSSCQCCTGLLPSLGCHSIIMCGSCLLQLHCPLITKFEDRYELFLICVSRQLFAAQFHISL